MRLFPAVFLALLLVTPAHAGTVRAIAPMHSKIDRVTQIRINRGELSKEAWNWECRISSSIRGVGIGAVVTVDSLVKGKATKRCLVVEICHPNHCGWHRRTGRLVELPKQLYTAFCPRIDGHPRDCPVQVKTG